MILLLLFLFDVSASFRMVEQGDNNLLILLEEIHEKLFPACSIAAHFDRSWSNNHMIFKVKSEKSKQTEKSLFQSPVPTLLTMEGAGIAGKQEVFNLIGRLPGHPPAHNKEFCILWKVFVKNPENLENIIAKLR